MAEFNGLGMHLGNVSRLSDAETRSISAENPTGAKGRGGMATEGTGAQAARELGQGWKVSPASTSPAAAPPRWLRSTASGGCLSRCRSTAFRMSFICFRLRLRLDHGRRTVVIR